MLRVSDADAGGVITVHADGVVSTEDVDRAWPEFERLVDTHGRPALLVDLVGVTGWRFGGAWTELSTGERRDRIGRTAVIGDSQWREWAEKVAPRLTAGEMRYFEPHEKDEALAWLGG